MPFIALYSVKRSLAILTLLVFKNVNGQNIVPNGSFEDVNICTEAHQPCSPSAWFYINHLAIGYFKSDIKPISGDKGINLVVVDTTSADRDYWQTMLLCPLEVGKNYKVSVKLASNYIGPNLHDIGLNFTDSFLFLPKGSMIQPGYYLNFLDARIKKLKNGWFEVQKEFTATSARRFLIIGNFSDKTNKQIAKERKIGIKRLYLSVDDLSIISTNQTACLDMQKVEDSLYAIKQRHLNPQHHDSQLAKVETPAKVKIDTIMINNIEFDVDSYKIKNSNMLQYLRGYLLDTTIKKIKIIGFTDNSGSPAYNKSLSEKRANAVANFLMKAFGLKESSLEVEGKGISNNYPEAQQNRRVEIYVYH